MHVCISSIYDYLIVGFYTIHMGFARIVLGEAAAQNVIDRNLAHLRATSRTLGWTNEESNNADAGVGVPTLIGEIGIPFDLDRNTEGVAEAYRTGDFTAQIRTLDRTMKALEKNILSFTLWNYAPKNSNQRGNADKSKECPRMKITYLAWNQQPATIYIFLLYTVPHKHDMFILGV